MTSDLDFNTKLFAALREGDECVRGNVLMRYESLLMILARHQMHTRLRRKFDPADVVQQALLEACRALPQFRGATEGELVAWLRAILARVLAHEGRRYEGAKKRDIAREVSLENSLAQSSQRLGQMLAASGTSPSENAQKREQAVILAEVLERLPDDYREVILLRNVEDLPHEEIARRMNRGLGAVRMLWVRALARLREEIGGE